jgi:hypothetical protein
MKSMKHGLLAAVATAALVAGASAFAQSPSAPSNSELQSGAKADAKAEKKTNAQTPMKDSGASAQGGAKVEGGAQTQSPSAPSGSGMQSGAKDEKKDTTQAQDSKQQPRGQAQERDMKPGTAQQRPGAKESGQAQDSKKTDSKTSVQTDSKASGSKTSVQLDDQQRTKISQTIRQKDVNIRRVSRSEINFTINVGAVVPRTVTLYPLPAPIIAVVPAYRGYLYIVVDDQLLIIHPQTLEIVAVIPA